MPNNDTTMMRLKMMSRELKDLNKLSYDTIATMMLGNDKYEITFSDRFDPIDDEDYKTVIVKNKTTGTETEYLAANKDSRKIYRNMIAALRRRKIDPILQVVDYNDSPKVELTCSVKSSLLKLPSDILEEFLSCSIEFSDGKDDDVSCFVKDEMLFFPSYLPSEYDILVKKIKCLILKQEPFCLEDLYDRLANIGYTDRKLILETLDELENEGFITHENIVPGNVDNPQYAFVPEGTDIRAVHMRRLGRSLKAFAASRTNEVEK